MARDNIEIVRRMLAFFHHGDAESALACFSRDVVADVSRRPDAEVATEYATIYGLRQGEIASMTP